MHVLGTTASPIRFEVDTTPPVMYRVLTLCCQPLRDLVTLSDTLAV